MNSNSGVKTTVFGNSGVAHQQPAHLRPQSQPQTHSRSHFPGHFNLSDPQARVLAQGHAQVQAPHARLQAQFHNHNAGNAGVSNVNASSPSVPTPGTGSGKRANQKPSSRPPGSSNLAAASPLKTMELTPAGPRKKRKLPENQLPGNAAALLPESAIYTRLLEYEARMDALLSRKKIEIQEALRNPSRFQKTLRIYVFNTFLNQTPTNSENTDGEPPLWSLKIIGRILEDGKDPVVGGTIQKAGLSHPKFSSFFKKITIYLDQSLYPDSHVILWDSERSPSLHEGFEVKRNGDKEFTVHIRLDMNYVPEKFKLSPALSDVVGLDVSTRPRVLEAIWHYVKTRNLQSSGDPSFFMCDPPLQKVFGDEKMKFVMVPQKLSQHLTPPQPIHLEHRIKLSGSSPAGTTCCDVMMDLPIPLDKEMSAFLDNIKKHQEIDSCDEKIISTIKEIHRHRWRRSFFRGFSQSPAEFINALIASQSRDLKLAAGDASRIMDKEHHPDFYNQSWVEDAVIRYLNRKSAVTDTPGSS
ncbi:SWIB domain-containing protein [Psidium guajava]|nr:SWIB domain-containing protein [Psidium guajava]